MLIYKSGDILEATENIICHQVNVQGVMGGGLALQIAEKYPEVEKEYIKHCKDGLNDYFCLKGTSIPIKAYDGKIIGNCFTQKPNFDTDYEAITECFNNILKAVKKYNRTIAVPFKYGCGIANGEWKIVENIFKDLSNQYDVDISVYKLEEICKD